MKKQEAPLSQSIYIRCHPELRALVEQNAAANYPDTMNDVIVRILAAHFKRPDLGKTPKKRMGRPPKERVPA
jgi:hypothetical protein